MVDEELGSAVARYLGWGTAARPGADEDAVRSTAASTPADQLVARVLAIVAESLGVPIDWGTLSLGDAGRAMAAEMATRHPELDRAALDALAWNFTFTWR